MYINSICKLELVEWCLQSGYTDMTALFVRSDNADHAPYHQTWLHSGHLYKAWQELSIMHFALYAVIGQRSQSAWDFCSSQKCCCNMAGMTGIVAV